MFFDVFLERRWLRIYTKEGGDDSSDGSDDDVYGYRKEETIVYRI